MGHECVLQSDQLSLQRVLIGIRSCAPNVAELLLLVHLSPTGMQCGVTIQIVSNGISPSRFEPADLCFSDGESIRSYDPTTTIL